MHFVQCHHLRYLLIKFRRCKVDSILEGVLDVSTRSANNIFPQNLWWLGYDCHRVLLWVGFFLWCLKPYVIFFHLPWNKHIPVRKTAYPKKESTTYHHFSGAKNCSFQMGFSDYENMGPGDAPDLREFRVPRLLSWNHIGCFQDMHRFYIQKHHGFF